MRVPGVWKRGLGCLLLAVGLQAATDSPVFREIGRYVSELSSITGLRVKKTVRYEQIDRARVNEYLKERVKEAVEPEQIRAEEITLKKFGFVPMDFNLEKSTVDLLTEQAAAFYDFRKKRLFLTNWTSSSMTETALVHELAHALADQHFNLEKFTRGAGESDDSALARISVMEGQASWLMSEVIARERGETLIGHPDLARMVVKAAEGNGSGYPVFDASPLYMRETLIFPYTSGMLFQQAVVDREGKPGFSRVFREPPVSTQQILHPEMYYDRVQPTRPKLPEAPVRKGWKTLAKGMVGELDHSILLRKAKADSGLATHWRGGVYEVLEDKAKTRTILLYAVDWDTADSATQYFEAYRRVLAAKWSRMEISRELPSTLSGTSEDGCFEVRLAGSVVRSVEGAEPPAGGRCP